MSLQNIVNVQISRETTAIPQAGFGAAMILETHNAFSGRVALYSSLNALSEDFASSTKVYHAASKYFAQSPTPAKLYVGSRLASRKITVATATNSAVYTVVVNGNSYAYTADGSALNTEIVAGLKALINAGETTVLADNTVTTTLKLIPVDNAGYSVSVEDAKLTLDPDFYDTVDVEDDLDACLRENKAWYGLLLTSRDAEEVMAAASWAESNKRLFATASNEAAIIAASDTTSIAYQLKNLYDHAISVYHADSDVAGETGWEAGNASYADAALLGRILPMDPGTYTAKFKSLSGVKPSDLNDTEIDRATAKFCNVYTSVASIPMFQHGQVSKPEWIDTIVGVDWLQARITERVFGKLVNLPKIPFTDAGIAVIEAEIKAQLNDAVNRGFLTADPAPVVVMPKAKDVSSNDKNNRELHGVTFIGYLAGAIHYTEIHGTVTV